MPNNFFKITPENENEIYEKWRVLTDNEIRTVSAAKSRIYVSVADMDLIQDGFEAIIKAHVEAGANMDLAYERRLMQMGYALEEIKQKLTKRIALEERLKNNDPEEG